MIWLVEFGFDVALLGIIVGVLVSAGWAAWEGVKRFLPQRPAVPTAEPQPRVVQCQACGGSGQPPQWVTADMPDEAAVRCHHCHGTGQLATLVPVREPVRGTVRYVRSA